MSTIRFLGFVRHSEVLVMPDLDAEKMVICLVNGFNTDVWIRNLPDAYELCVVIDESCDRRAVESLIRCDLLLESFRSRRFLVGEIMPGDLARYVLITLKKEVES